LKLLNKIRDIKKRHTAFRNYYTERQIYLIEILSIIGIAHGITGYLWTWKFFINVEKHGKTGFAMILAISVVSLLLTLLGKYVFRFKSNTKKTGFFEVVSMIMAVGFFAWSYLVMYFSIVEERTTNYITILILYAIATMLLYYSVFHYLALFCLCVLGALHQVFFVMKSDFDLGVLINVIILGFVMSIAATVRYMASLREFEAKMEAEKYRDKLKKSNEELSKNNEELNNLTNKLIIANNTQKRFTANMNHELRSPLNGTIGLLQILKEDKSLTGEQADYVNRALDSSKTLIQIVNDILDHAKIEAGEFRINIASFDLRDVVKNVADITEGQAKAKGLSLYYDIDENTPCKLIGDGVRIQQIITNLVTNGIKYTSEGSVTLSLSVGGCDSKEGKEELVICVKDTGQGIAEESLPYIFDAFKRVNENENQHIQGTGLGLSIVRNLVDSMEGNIEVKSEVNKGSAFIITIPIKVESYYIKFYQRVEKARVEVEAPDFSKYKFLAVDDNKVNLSVFNGLMKKTMAKVELAYGGQEALKMLDKEKYDIVFLDHRMPDPDGLEVFRRLRAGNGINAHTPVIILTANAGDEAVDEYRQIGFNGYLSKPVIKEQLYEITKENI